MGGMGQAAGVTICKDLNARLPLPKSLDEAEALDKAFRGTKWLDITDPGRESIIRFLARPLISQRL